MSSLKVGVIGAGAVAPSHCIGVRKHPQAELLAIADVNSERAASLAEEYKIPKTYSGFEEILSDGDIDAVSIALPNFLHSKVAIAALESGKHVQLDKPFAMSYGEALRIVDTAKAAEKLLAVGMNQRFTTSSQTIRSVVQKGGLGETYAARALWCRRTGAPKFGTWFTNKKKSGGGSLLDIGVHMLDLCLYLIDNFKPLTVSGSTYTKFGNRGIGEGNWGKSDVEAKIFDVDDSAFALIKLDGGVTVNLESSWVRHQSEQSELNVYLFGTEAGAEVSPAKLCRFGRDEGEYEVVDIANAKLRYPHCNRTVNWIDAILGNDELECKPEQSLVVQRILDAIYESSASGREVFLAE